MSVDSDHYAVLGIPANSASAAIREAYRSSMRTCHPDLNQNEDAAAHARIVNEAYRVLRDPKTRALYDSNRSRIGRASGDRSPPNGSFAALSERRQEIHILAPPVGPARAPWLSFLVFVLLAAGGFLGIVSSGKLDPAPVSAPANNNLAGRGRGDQRIDDLIATIVDDRSVGAAQPTGASVGEEAADARPEEMTSALPTIHGSDLAYGAEKFAEVSLRSGMVGAQNYSMGCHQWANLYPSWQRADRCAAFDSTAILVDGDLARSMHSYANQYFLLRQKGADNSYRALGASSFEGQMREFQIRQAIVPLVITKASARRADRH